VINPRLVTVSEILRHIRRGRIHSVNRVADSHAEILELEAQPGSRIVGGPLKSIKFPKGALIGGILSDDIMEIPNGETEIHPGQRVVVFTLAEEVKTIEKLFGAF
jgi:trk system potassium uptake protein TrkA